MCNGIREDICLPAPALDLDRPADGSGSEEREAGTRTLDRIEGGLLTREDVMDRAIESAVTRALFSRTGLSRRSFLRLAGTGTLTSILSSVLPLDAAKAAANDPSFFLEKKGLQIGFLPSTCATPFLVAESMGFFDKHGLTGTKTIKAKNWTAIRDSALANQLDCTQMLSPMPLALALGAETTVSPFSVPALSDLNGQAITLHLKHKQVAGPRDMKGFVFAVPFEYSMHNFLLRYYLAEGGLDPDQDASLRPLPPSQMLLYLKSDRIDGFVAPEPFNQRAVHDSVGFIFRLSKDIWPGHPCCAFAASRTFAWEMPNSFGAAIRAVVDATMFSHKPENRKEIARLLSPSQYLDQPVEVLEQVLTGQFPDGLGNMHNVPDRIDFNPFPWDSMAVWILTQMKRWGYVKADVDYKTIAEEVFRAADCADIMKEQGYEAPTGTYRKHTIMGKEFDPAKPEEYLKSFTITRS